MSKAQILFVALMLWLAGAPAVAADTPIQPMPMEECRAIAVTFTKVTGIKLDIAEGPEPIAPDGLRGRTCRMIGKATGLTLNFEKTEQRITAAFQGWTGAEADADGAFSAIRSFKNGNRRVVYGMETVPPKGTCLDDRPIVDCKVPRKRWVWNIWAAAYTQP